ncbi:hypothetical protein [Paenibacillus sp. J2TS4]|uniref:hypothetical protein n=1 Tax=Paenibacillus sp. J2TS4 TaxID=2807194 RepID=UPI001B14C4F3|nr:hypothetical protein [Paenibacillus sp. J2TS4]GIP35955.1 hypothetical protein J2TS4_51650 [Paenibacillus sp. J2TS4]
MEKEKTLLDELSQEREGYVMKNPSNGIEIKCTEKFVKHWENRGFVTSLKHVFPQE